MYSASFPLVLNCLQLALVNQGCEAGATHLKKVELEPELELHIFKG